MPLPSGARLGPYEIVAPIGAGGMGEVYRASDTKLRRDVALKVLPETFARDAGRISRFQREAKLLAALNHPHIASIYGLEDSNDTYALVMELVEGPTLANRIRSRSIPIEEALPIAQQICEALEYAHEHGIVHRDLKPANVKVTNDDAVKVLDFGLAKAIEGDAPTADLADSPTISRMATQAGVLLGTAAYMSPEQANGKVVDRRADIWAFGCVLYEMLTGRTAFGGETVTDILAAVIRDEPDWTLLPAATPMRVQMLLQRCLRKNHKQRLQAIGDARIVLDEVLSGVPDSSFPAQLPAPFWRRALPWVVVAILLVGLAQISFLYLGGKPGAPAGTVRFQITMPRGNFSLSPDGRELALIGPGADGRNVVWIRPLDSLQARALHGTEGIPTPSFWSADSRHIAFQSEGQLKTIDIFNGSSKILCDVKGAVLGGAWNADDEIIFGTDGNGIMQVPAAGGVPTLVTSREGRNEVHTFPSFLPDGRHFVYLRAPQKAGLYIGSIDLKPQQQTNHELLATPFMPVFAPSANSSIGELLFLREGTLLAQPFDSRRMQLAGEALPLADHLENFLLSASFSASANGVLAYRNSTATSIGELRWFDRQGKARESAGNSVEYTYTDLSLSPDGTRVAAARIEESGANSVQGIWLLDLSREISTRFTFDPTPTMAPVWSRDGSRIAYAATRAEGVGFYQRAANGTGKEEVLFNPTHDEKVPNDWSRDGRFLLYTLVGPRTKADLWILPLASNGTPSGTPEPFANSEFDERQGQFSPDGHWIAYVSDESGRPEIYIQPFPSPPGGGSKTPISRDGGNEPRWRRDGKELFYISLAGKLMAADVSSNPVVKAGLPKALFPAPIFSDLYSFHWDVTANGQRFLINTAPEQANSAPITVELNWTAGLNK